MKIHSGYSLILSLVLVSDFSTAQETYPLYVPRNPSPPDTLSALAQTLYQTKLSRREKSPKNTTTIAKSWDGATLFSLDGGLPSKGSTSISAGIEVTCTTCYVKGNITAELGFDGDFNFTQAITNFTRDVAEEIGNVTDAAISYLHNETVGFLKNLTDDLDFSDISFAPLDVDFNVDVPDIPECRLRFQFDDLELYMLIDTVLSAGTTYTLNLYSTNTPLGLSVDSETFVGVIASIDLILGADADINISSGVHIRVDDGMTLDLSLFSQNVTSVTFNGGTFAFLPVTVQTANGVLTARLRFGVHAGVSLESKELSPFIPVSTGTEVLVYADLAEFTTNITAVPDGDDTDCQLRVQQVYQLALGAAAGATIAIGPETWGPAPSTKIPIFYTTLADECARSATQTTAVTITTTPTPTVVARADDDMTTTTLSDKVTFTGVSCILTGLDECPVSLQSTTKVTSTRTLVVEVPSGSEAAFPATTQDGVSELIPFAENIKTVAATTGSPVSYTPPPPPPTTSSPSSSSATTTAGQGGGDEQPQKTSGTDNRPLIIGLSVGLGVPFLAAIVVGIYFAMRRRKYAAVAGAEVFQVVSPQHDASNMSFREKKTVTTMITTVRGPGGR
ncbi:hypothetical protein F5B22DRAFT_646298 [Xylaria bambusicola]|uniref:uncharacterized protein n=1 Tax=Xylaria bambusicola TaxID=326684 RepID=UPI0020076C20|nr:uncharacterized protein F5B22DRAFT_646298 [Xylaria bambusicola]KAI0516953.1 hypothetical protein F5B22DRAFT_646298 [Xylaria bambusicola]